jgi:large subunit ribosomal protein L3
MISGFIVKKGQMTQIYTENGKRIAVTRCTAAPLKVTQIKTTDKDGYQAIQFAYGSKKNQDKPTSDKLKKIKVEISPKGFVEFKPLADTSLEVGADLSFDSVFQVGDKVDVTGISKGRGFAGVIKRHGFQRQPVTGGQSDRTRAPGAIGAQTPEKFSKVKKCQDILVIPKFPSLV